MAENSLFAILMRSRWWISFAICAAVALISFAAFPKDIAPFAALGAFPFFIVGCIAAYKQLRAPSAAQAQQLLDECAALPWKQFSQRLAAGWQAEGYGVEFLNQNGADLRLTRKGQTTVVQAKRWKAANQGLEPLRELQAQQQKLEASHAVYVTLQPLTENAAAWAKQQQIALLGPTEIALLLAKAK